MTILHIDFETRSAVDLKKSGVMRYAASPTTEVLCLAWSLGNMPPESRSGLFTLPTHIIDHIASGGKVGAHNAAFEYYIWNKVFAKDSPGIPLLKWEQLDCTMARAYQVGLPGALDGALEALGAEIRKDVEGGKIMRRYCSPMKWQDGKPIFRQFEINGQDAKALRLYCEADVLAEMELDRLLPPLAEREQKLWYVDKRINERGVPFDMKVVKRAAEVADVAVDRANRRLSEITGGIAGTINQRDRILDFVRQHGHAMPDLRKDTVEDAFARMPNGDPAKEALTLRKEYSKSSVAKFSKVLDWHVEGRTHGTMEYHGAHTGRWAGRGPQLQNLRRYDDENPYERDKVTMMQHMLRTMPAGDIVEACELMGEEVLDTLSLSLRRSITARKEHRLVGADFSNIEGRIAAWIADEEWKLQAYREFDAGTGADLYKVTASTSLNMPMDQIDKKFRQIGKVQELALGYQGSVDAIARFVGEEGMATMAETALAISPKGSAEYEKAEWQWKRTITNVDPDVWIGLKVLINKWREANSRICECWYALHDAIMEAVQFKGQVIKAAGCQLVSDEKFMHLQLPTGRTLSYPDARPGKTRRSYLDDNGDIKEESVRCVTYRRRGKWVDLYGGLVWENVVQATARDVLVESLLAVDQEMPDSIIAHTHDEILVEVPNYLRFNVEDLVGLMVEQPLVPGCPIAASGWTGREYAK